LSPATLVHNCNPTLISWRLIFTNHVNKTDFKDTLKPVYSYNISTILELCREYVHCILNSNCKIPDHRPESYSLTCSEICLHIRGSVCMNSEHVFLFSSLGLVARLLLWWLPLPSLTSRLYLLWGGWGSSIGGADSWDFVGPFVGADEGVGSSSAEFWMWSIHCTISSLMPQPPTWPKRDWKLQPIYYTTNDLQEFTEMSQKAYSFFFYFNF